MANPDTPPPDTSPEAAVCPLCGAANDCRLARGEGDVAACWCAAEEFPPALLGRVPPARRGRACICRACLEQARELSSGR